MIKKFLRLILSFWVIPKNLILYKLGCKNNNSCKVVKNLCNNGYYIFEDKINQSDVENLIEEYNEMFKNIPVKESGQDIGRIYMPHLKSNLVDKYVNKFIVYAKEYFGDQNMKIELSMFQKSMVQTATENIPGGEYHMDDNKKNLKFFIYLTDVSENNGPFTLSPATHGPQNINDLIRWIGWEITGKRKYLYYKELPHSSPNPIQVLGNKGTVFCADTTILHKAEALEKGERLVLVISFAEKRFDPYSFLSSKKSYIDINEYY